MNTENLLWKHYLVSGARVSIQVMRPLENPFSATTLLGRIPTSELKHLLVQNFPRMNPPKRPKPPNRPQTANHSEWNTVLVLQITTEKTASNLSKFLSTSHKPAIHHTLFLPLSLSPPHYGTATRAEQQQRRRRWRRQQQQLRGGGGKQVWVCGGGGGSEG